jgi:aminopeptidase
MVQNKKTSNMLEPLFLNDFKKELSKLLRGRTLYRKDIHRLRSHLTSIKGDTEKLLTTAHEINRIMAIHKAGLGHNKKFYNDYTQGNYPLWNATRDMDVAHDLQIQLANKLYNAEKGDSGALLLIGDRARTIAHNLIERLTQDGIKFWPEFMDGDFKNLVLSHARRDGIKRLAAYDVATNAKANKKIVAIPNGSAPPKIEAALDKKLLYAEECRPMRMRSSSGDMFFTLTCFPTEKDAERDDIPYKDYLKLYFEMCDQPWDEISKAQEHLIEMFNKASIVRFTNNDGTDISMSLIDHDGSHFTFCNSVIAKNVPGSEIFSAPHIDSVEGVIVAKGKFSPKDTGTKVIENLTMIFEKGVLVDFKADKGAEHFQEFIDRNPGNRRIGELGIGTNPHLKTHVMNTLLVEKIGGSFHLALGNAYTFNEYAGAPVKVDNGNRSLDHWDITTMLIGKKGRIELDGQAIMEDGKFLDPALEVLNTGWAHIPEKDRPAYWKDYKGPQL